jgi:maleate isomerase
MIAPDRRIGTITPSSNTVVEFVTQAIAADLAGVGAHFARVPFAGDKIHLSDRHDTEAMLLAARLLADARMDAICWNGSKAAGIDFEIDRTLCRAIAERTETQATTSVLALESVLRRKGVRRIALATPFVGGYQEKLISVLAREGFETIAESHLDIADNYAIGLVAPAAIADQVRRLGRERPDAVLIVCTNYCGAPIVAEMERELGLPVFDSVSVGVWGALRLAGVDTAAAAARWGTLFVTDG